MDLAGRRAVPEGVVRRMTRALVHRGPDEEGFLVRPGLVLGSRRLSIVGLADGQQPVCNEDQSAFAVFNGELFDYVEQREELMARGHHLRSHCDTEIIPHLWEECSEGMFERLRGQFAIALYDARRHQLTLGRDRFGICPLYWTRQGDWLLFASEIKGILASGMVAAKADLWGLDQVFTFAAMPGPLTCFDGVRMVLPAHYLQITPTPEGGMAPVLAERCYWRMDFPNQGDEGSCGDPRLLADELEDLLLKAVARRLRADVPVGAYLSGGLDSSMIVAMACRLKGPAINTYTIRVDDPELDELSAANLSARHIGTKPPVVLDFRAADALAMYPQLIQAAEAPVIDTSCAALLMLARRVHACGQKVVLTGEGADEWLAGYPWYKIAKLFDMLDLIPGLRLSNLVRRTYLRIYQVPQYPAGFRNALETSVGGPNAWIDSYGVLALSKLRFYAAPMREVLEHSKPWDDLGLDPERARHWHPLNRGLWVGARVTLAHGRQDGAFADRCLEQAQRLQHNIERHAWDGQWYRRAYFDNGEALGSQTNAECQIDSLPQSWAVISGAGEAGRTRQAMLAVDQRLVHRQTGLIQLFDPPFDSSSSNPGYIKGYIPGVRENGGQYTHAAIWSATAFALLGDSERAWELFSLLNPIHHGSTPEQVATYKAEPYVVAADVYALPPHTGRGGWSWYTGAAAWMYRLLVETLLGINLEGDKLRLKPLLPAAWPACKIHYRYRQTIYHISVTRLSGEGADEPSLALDGERLVGDCLRLSDDGLEHTVEMLVR